MVDLEEKIFTAIGEASMCWIPTPEGVFDSTKATDVGDRLWSEVSLQFDAMKKVIEAARAIAYSPDDINIIEHKKADDLITALIELDGEK